MLLEDREVNSPGPDRAVVFQNHCLLPWLTVYDNVRLAVDKVLRRAQAQAPSGTTGPCTISTSCRWRTPRTSGPSEISGGMKQRVGIARALAMEPKVLLLDEPFGALDALTRAHLQDSLMQIHAALGNTVIMITHDVDEAVLLSDRIVMMTNGPSARIGEVLAVPLPRPRKRLELVADPTYLQAPRGGAGLPLRAPPLRRSRVSGDAAMARALSSSSATAWSAARFVERADRRGRPAATTIAVDRRGAAPGL